MDRDKGLPIVRNERQTLAHYLASWLEMMRPPHISAKTYDRYEELVRLHIVPTLGKVSLARLTPQHVQALYSSKRDALSPTTVHHIHAVLHTALQSALRLGLVQRNVCDLVQKPRMGRAEMKTWNPEQAKAFLDAAEGDRLHALYVLALSTGMRQGELFGLRWRDVDLDGASLSVVTNLRRSRVAGTELAEPKTRGSRRRIALTPSTVVVLREHRTRQLEERLRLGAAWEDHDLVFADTTGTPLRANNVERRHFGPIMRKAGVPRIRFHDLRHTAATLLLVKGINPKIVSEMLGHASVTITLDKYSHVLPSMQLQAAAAMEDVLWG